MCGRSGGGLLSRCRVLRGRFNLEHGAAVVADPYDLVRFIGAYKTNLNYVLTQLATRQRRFRNAAKLFPTPMHVEGGLERGGDIGRSYTLRDIDDPLKADNAALAFLRHPEIDGVNLRRDYTRLLRSIHDNFVVPPTPPAGPVGIFECKRVLHSCWLFHRASANGVAPDVHELTGLILPVLPSKWPLPASSVVTGRPWFQSMPSSPHASQGLGLFDGPVG